MAQPRSNEFTEIQFEEAEERAVLLSFTASQFQLLQNFRAEAARAAIAVDFSDREVGILEHAYQRGRIEVMNDVLSKIADSQQYPSQDESQPGD